MKWRFIHHLSYAVLRGYYCIDPFLIAESSYSNPCHLLLFSENLQQGIRYYSKYPLVKLFFVLIIDVLSRIISAFFYRGHSPNLDFFQVRPEFKEISKGLKPKVTFQEYIEMPEYQNIFTRMLGADSFPYRNITITDAVSMFLKYFKHSI